MKKIIFTALAVLVSTGAFAQKFEWGIKAGLNLANVTKIDDSKFKPGFTAGAFGEYVINDFFGVQAELLYSMEGYKYDKGGLKITDTRDYLNLPIFAKFYVLEGLSVDIGPKFGYALSAKRKTEGATAGNGTHKYYSDDNFKKFDASAVMGLSYRFAMGLDVFARYNLGFTKINDGSDSKNSAITIGAGYRF